MYLYVAFNLKEDTDVVNLAISPLYCNTNTAVLSTSAKILLLQKWKSNYSITGSDIKKGVFIKKTSIYNNEHNNDKITNKTIIIIELSFEFKKK